MNVHEWAEKNLGPGKYLVHGTLIQFIKDPATQIVLAIFNPRVGKGHVLTKVRK